MYWSHVGISMISTPVPNTSLPSSTKCGTADRRRIEGNLDLDAAWCRAVARAGERPAACCRCRWPGRAGNRAPSSQRSTPHRVALDEPRTRRGLAEHHACGGDEVTADVHQAAAAELGDVADVGRVGVEVAETPIDAADIADAAVGRSPRAQPLRMRAHHERLLDLHARPVARCDELRASAADSPIGFSHSTCLPPRPPVVHGTWR